MDLKIKKISCISFTANGSRINRRLKDWLEAQGISCDSQGLARYAGEAGIQPLQGNLQEWCQEHFSHADALIFIGATGIAVRGIAPYVKDKNTDPAVLVIDEQGNFVISLLSGHIGGANEITRQVAAFLGAVPVITTGTDVNHTFAVDVFAQKNHLQIDSMQKAKEIAAALIDKKKVEFFSELPVETEVPSVLKPVEMEIPSARKPMEGKVPSASSTFHFRIAVTVHEPGEILKPSEDKIDLNTAMRADTLRLIPKNVHLGIGCRKGTPAAVIEQQVQKVMKQCQLDWKAIAGAASIDLKKDEEGLRQFCKDHYLPFHVYTAEELQEVEGNFTPSSFVGNITGVENVCERSAALDCIRQRIYANTNNKNGNYHMIQKKVAENGVTVAIAMEDWSVRFE